MTTDTLTPPTGITADERAMFDYSSPELHAEPERAAKPPAVMKPAVGQPAVGQPRPSRDRKRTRGWFGRSTPARSAEDLLPSPERFDRIIHVELMRADRSGTRFCLAVFSLPPTGDCDEYDFAAYLLSRLRATDHAGCLGRRRIAVVLWDTNQAGAEKFVENILAQCPLPGRPDVQIYVYPFQKLPPVEPDEPTPPGKPLDDLLVRPLPFWKRTLDIFGASVGIVLLSPLLAATALAIRWTSPGPAVFTQTRDGLGGRRFKIYKFRTMYSDAEARKAALRAQSEQDGPAFKLANDPRITPIGSYLRKTCIDELPQLLNVLKGDMSLVGPRPLDSREAAGCEDWQRRRQWVTPGLTCIWQVDGKSRVPFTEWMRMDLRYIGRRNLWTDTKLVIRTACAVVLHRASH